MGMAASQGRLLSITARLSNNEFEQQSIAYSKQRLSDDSEQINDKYLDALNQTKYQILTGYNGTEACYEDLSYNQLTGINTVATGKQYMVKNNQGKVLVSEAIANAFRANNGDYNKFLYQLGYSQANIDLSNSASAEEAVHQAWDKYLVSVGKSINDMDSQHILSFGYTSFSKESFDGFPTYNTAYAASSDGSDSFSLQKEGGRYYTTRSTVVAKEYTDEKGDTQTGVYFQTPEQEGTDEYTQLLDVTYNKATGEFTYKNDDKEEVKTKTLYASLGKNGKAIVSENEKNYLTLNNNTGLYDSESGHSYKVTENVTALNFEGTTSAQRELYDYALSLTEAYYNQGQSGTLAELKAKNSDYNDTGKLNYYKNIFDEMRTSGFTTLKESYSDKLSKTESTSNMTSENKIFQDSEWFVNQLKSGNLVLSYYSASEKAFVGTTIDDDESITEKEDKSAIAIAEQEYNTSLDRIESEEKKFDMQLTKLESEHSALQTEYDSVAKVISKNVEKSFNIFNA